MNRRRLIAAGVLGGSAPVPWYLDGGVSPISPDNVLRAYQAIGAFSYNQAKTNLANTTEKMTDAAATKPTWSTTAGFTMNGTSQFINTGIILPNRNCTVIFRLANGNVDNAWRTAIGAYNNPSGSRYEIGPTSGYAEPSKVNYVNGQGNTKEVAPALGDGTLAIAGTKAYRNGVLDDTLPNNDTLVPSIALYLGARNNNPSPVQYWGGNVLALAAYDIILTADQIKSVHDRMMLLPERSVWPSGFPIWPLVSDASASFMADPLSISTYDGSGYTVHPDVIDFGAGGWNGHRYWMAITPYPNEDPAYENPSIYYSDNKTTWAVPDGLTNPIESTPVDGFYNSDPGLIFDDASNKLYCFWREWKDSISETVYCMESTNGITWTNKQTVLSGETWNTVISPSIIYNGSQYVMYTVDRTVASPYQVLRRTSSSLTGPWSEAQAITLDDQPECRHIDVIYVPSDGRYYAVITGAATAPYFAVSTDGVSFSASAFMTGAVPAWTAILYRASISRSDTGFDMWYTGNSAPKLYQLGYTEISWI